MDYTVYQKAIKMSREVFDYAKDVHGIQMTILDMGGGFPGEEGSLEKFSHISKSINEALCTHFSDIVGLKVMAEPGRYFATSICTAFAKVISRRQIGDNGRKVCWLLFIINTLVHYHINHSQVYVLGICTT